MTASDRTLSPELRSWIDSANDPRTDFPIQNLPLGVFAHRGSDDARIGVAIGDRVADLRALTDAGFLDSLEPGPAECCRAGTLNRLMALDRNSIRALRGLLSDALSADGPVARDPAMQRRVAFHLVQMLLIVHWSRDDLARIGHRTQQLQAFER